MNTLLDLLRDGAIEFQTGSEHGQRILIFVASGLKQDRSQRELKEPAAEDRETLFLLLALGDAARRGQLGNRQDMVAAHIRVSDLPRPVSDQDQIDPRRQVAAEISLPAFAIGGITPENLPQVLATGIGGVAIGGAIATVSDPTAVVSAALSEMKSAS